MLVHSGDPGADAPQWIEIDLEGAYDVSEINLLVAQWPEGPTHHLILIHASGVAGFTAVHEFQGSTKEGDRLSFAPVTPIPNVEIIRVESISSPSWIAWAEIQVYGEPPRSP